MLHITFILTTYHTVWYVLCMSRKTAKDWYVAGVLLLREKGFQGLTISALCQQLQVTKGSFYHHFSGIDEYKSNLLAFYETEGTLDIITQLEDQPTPQAKLINLADLIVQSAGHYSMNAERMLRVWSLQDEEAQIVQTRVDARRRAYVQELCSQIVADTTQAETMATMMYAILIGSELMHPPLTPETLRALFTEFFRLYQIEME